MVAQGCDHQTGSLATKTLRHILPHQFPRRPLPALAGNPGAGYAAKEGCFWGAEVITIKAGHRDGLEYMQFKVFHRLLFLLGSGLIN